MPRSGNYQFKFSFVIPVYNVEPYLSETVDSILNQTMSFVDNCEIIFVNDGSSDGSEGICLEYKKRFPDNIQYLSQKNAGPGAARNAGAAKARGKYINPLDSDDKLSPNTLEEVYRFFEEHYDEIDVVGIKWEFFEAQTGPHPLNYKFTADKIIDLKRNFIDTQGSAAPAFFKAEVFQRHKFDPSVGRYSEDLRFMGEVLLDKQKYGVVTKPTYYYRKRLTQTSSQDLNTTDKFWYLETPKRALGDLFEYAKAKQGNIPKFIQYMVMYDLQWRYRMSKQAVLSEKDERTYKQLLLDLLKQVDDEVILAQKVINTELKLFLLSKKHGESVLEKARLKDRAYYYHRQKIYDLKVAHPTVYIDFFQVKDDFVTIEGYFNGFLFKGSELIAQVGDNWFKTYPVKRYDNLVLSLGEVAFDRNSFKIHIPIKPGRDISFFLRFDGHKIYLPIVAKRFTGLASPARLTYKVFDNLIVVKTAKAFKVTSYTIWRHFKRELKYNLVLLKRRKLGLIIYRLAYYLGKALIRRPVWLVSDRLNAADDNGEVLFRYLMGLPTLQAKTYFLLSKSSQEFKAISAVGPVLDFHSFKAKLMFLLSSKIISSEATEYVVNLFGDDYDYVSDLTSFDFVFLQHGIIRDDISNWLNRYKKNIKLFVTSAVPERKSILSGRYNYQPDDVVLSGLPRFDLLGNRPKRKLVLAPTWRENLTSQVDPVTGVREYNPNFNSSEYFKFFQGLMNDGRLHKVMKQHNIKGELYLHPSFQQQSRDFSGNKMFKVMNFPHDYRKMKSEGSLLVTDYSSVAFDFAYLRKPVIYAQFDEDTYYKLSTSQRGYLDYETDGLGPVTHDCSRTVDEIIKTIEAGCVMDTVYLERTDNFFAYTDRYNSQRVYEAIAGV